MDVLSEYYIMIRSLNGVNLALSAYPDPVTVNDNATATHMCLQQRILPCGPHTIQQAKVS